MTALTLLQGPGPESWHPDPEFLFAKGAGPLFDLGPYYLSVLAMLFGPATSVAAVGRRPRDSRVIGSGPRAGTEFTVAVPTYVAALAEYAGGQAASLLFSWDSPLGRAGFVEITGTEATLAVPDPNRFDGDLRVRRAGDDDWTVIPAAGAAAGRGTGVVDMVRAIRRGEPHRASGELALHVLEMMTAIERSASSAAFEPVETRFDAPGALDHNGIRMSSATAAHGHHRRRHDRLRVHGPCPLAGLAYGRAASSTCRVRPRLAAICGRDEAAARAAADRLGWAAVETDWRALIARDDVQLIDISAPGDLHAPIAIAALAGGQARAVREAARQHRRGGRGDGGGRGRRRTRLARGPWSGFNYRRVPALALARQLVETAASARCATSGPSTCRTGSSTRTPR